MSQTQKSKPMAHQINCHRWAWCGDRLHWLNMFFAGLLYIIHCMHWGTYQWSQPPPISVLKTHMYLMFSTLCSSRENVSLSKERQKIVRTESEKEKEWVRGRKRSTTRRYQQGEQPPEVRFVQGSKSLLLMLCVELRLWLAVTWALNFLVDGFYFWHRCEFPSVATAMLWGKWWVRELGASAEKMSALFELQQLDPLLLLLLPSYSVSMHYLNCNSYTSSCSVSMHYLNCSAMKTSSSYFELHWFCSL